MTAGPKCHLKGLPVASEKLQTPGEKHRRLQGSATPAGESLAQKPSRQSWTPISRPMLKLFAMARSDCLRIRQSYYGLILLRIATQVNVSVGVTIK